MHKLLSQFAVAMAFLAIHAQSCVHLLLQEHSGASSRPHADALLLAYGMVGAQRENLRLATASVQQGLVPAVVDWCGQQPRRQQYEKVCHTASVQSGNCMEAPQQG